MCIYHLSERFLVLSRPFRFYARNPPKIAASGQHFGQGSRAPETPRMQTLHIGSHSHTASHFSVPPKPPLPHIILIEPTRKPGGLIEHWEKAIKKYFPPEQGGESPFTIYEGTLEGMDPGAVDALRYDAALSEAFMGPDRDYWLLTNQVQAHLREHWRGHLPPGSCAIVPMPDPVCGAFDPSTKRGNKWGATSLACLPTMRVPDSVRWHEDLVYNCMWSLLVAVESWNKSPGQKKKIERVMMTGLATGYGSIPANKCAEQMVLAAKHFDLPPWAHGRPRWSDVVIRTNEIVDTIILDKKNAYVE